ncbi:MAG: non-oxidative hydroxyarylic acid decarboxylases subunit D [Gammaproteobacteria bacterium]
MNSCPRCDKTNLRLEHQGREQGEVVWTIFYCEDCGYSFRDSEDERVLVRDQRRPEFNLESTNPEDYPFMMAPNPRKKNH